jgi:hypothetical protein
MHPGKRLSRIGDERIGDEYARAGFTVLGLA